MLVQGNKTPNTVLQTIKLTVEKKTVKGFQTYVHKHVRLDYKKIIGTFSQIHTNES